MSTTLDWLLEVLSFTISTEHLSLAVYFKFDFIRLLERQHIISIIYYAIESSRFLVKVES